MKKKCRSCKKENLLVYLWSAAIASFFFMIVLNIGWSEDNFILYRVIFATPIILWGMTAAINYSRNKKNSLLIFRYPSAIFLLSFCLLTIAFSVYFGKTDILEEGNLQMSTLEFLSTSLFVGTLISCFYFGVPYLMGYLPGTLVRVIMKRLSVKY